MDFTKTAIHIFGVPITWNGVLNWLFLIASILTLFIAVALQIVQSIKNWKKTCK